MPLDGAGEAADGEAAQAGGFFQDGSAGPIAEASHSQTQHQDWNGTTAAAPVASAHTGDVAVPDFHSHPAFSFEGPSDRKSKSVQSCTGVSASIWAPEEGRLIILCILILEECRRRKIKCDRVFPCGPCKIRNEPDICVEYVKTKVAEPSGYTLVSDFRLLASRTEKLEDFLQSLYGRPSHRAHLDASSDIARAVERLPEANTADKTSMAEGLPEHLIWDGNFQNPFSDQSLDSVVPSLPQASLPLPLPLLSGLQSTSGGGGASQFDTAVYPFNDDNGLSGLPIAGPSQPRDVPQEKIHAEPTEAVAATRSSTPSDTDHEAALALEDMALNRHHARLKSMFSGTPAYTYRHLPPPSLGPLISLQSVLSDWHRTPVLLPDLRNLRMLASDYVDRYLWIQRCLHVPSFNHELETFLTSAAERGGDIYFEPKFTSFASLLFAICATSIHFASIQDCTRYGVDPGQQTSACTQWIDSALTLLHKAEWLQRHDVVALQTVLVLGPILSATDKGEMHWAMVGSAIKVAQAMNFCNLVSESIYAEKTPQSRALGQGYSKTSLPLPREIGRRIWAHLVEVDWLFASEHNFAYSVHPAQNRTAEVSNVSDNDLTMALTLKPLPEHIWTESSYTIWKDRMIHPYREFLDGCLVPSKPALPLIQECDAKLNKLANNLPAFYQMQTDLTAVFPNFEVRKQVHVERIAIQSGLHTRLLRVHRTVLRRAYRNHRYDSSREACIKSAATILGLAEEWLKTNMLIAGWWPVVYGVFSASVVLFITMCRDERLAEAHENSISRGIQIIRDLPGPVSVKRGHMAGMLEKLLDGRRRKLSSTSMTAMIPVKRKYHDDSERGPTETPLDDRMERFVDKLVAKTPNSTGAGAFPTEQRSDQGSSVDNSFYAGDALNTFDFNFDFGISDPFQDIMRMTEASLNGTVNNQTLWPWD